MGVYWKFGSPSVCRSVAGLADKLACLAEFLYEFDLRADNT